MEVKEAGVARILGPPPCPGNFTFKRLWNVIDTKTGIGRRHEQLIYISNTQQPVHTPRPICLWRPQRYNASLSPQYSLGTVQSSPFFNFGKPDICSVSVKVDFLGCVSMRKGSTSATECLYDAAKDLLTLTALEDGDVWNVTARVTDSCGNTNFAWSPLAVSITDDSEAPDSVRVNDIDYPCVDVSPCPNRVVDARLPSATNKFANTTAQVCTLVDAQAIGTSTVRLCLSTTRNRPQCVESASSGRLRAIFLDTRNLGLADPSEMVAINSTVKIVGRCNPATAGGTVTSCGGWRAQQQGGQATEPFFNLGLELAETDFSSPDGNAEMGCFFLEAGNLTDPKRGLEVGLAYSDVSGSGTGTTSTMVGRVCIPRPVAPVPPNAQRSVISTRLPQVDGGGDGPLVCIKVLPPTVLSASTTGICLATTTQHPGCARSARSGRLDRILLDTTPLGIANPDQLSFESGWNTSGGPAVRVVRPYCTRSPINSTQPTSLGCLSGQGVAQLPARIKGNPLTVALPLFNVTWQAADQDLGCFYVTYPNLYVGSPKIPADFLRNWAFAFGFSDLKSISLVSTASASPSPTPSSSGVLSTGAATYVGGLTFFDAVPKNSPSTATVCPKNVVTLRVPQGDNQAKTSQVNIVFDAG